MVGTWINFPNLYSECRCYVVAFRKRSQGKSVAILQLQRVVKPSYSQAWIMWVMWSCNFTPQLYLILWTAVQCGWWLFCVPVHTVFWKWSGQKYFINAVSINWPTTALTQKVGKGLLTIMDGTCHTWCIMYSNIITTHLCFN